MKRIILFVLIMTFSSGTSTVIASKHETKNATENPAVTSKKENNLSEEELNRITKRVEEISRMDRSALTAKEKHELKQELRGYRDRGYGHRHRGGVIYIGGGTILLIIILVILLA